MGMTKNHVYNAEVFLCFFTDASSCCDVETSQLPKTRLTWTSCFSHLCIYPLLGSVISVALNHCIDQLFACPVFLGFPCYMDGGSGCGMEVPLLIFGCCCVLTYMHVCLTLPLLLRCCSAALLSLLLQRPVLAHGGSISHLWLLLLSNTSPCLLLLLLLLLLLQRLVVVVVVVMEVPPLML